MHAYYFSTVTMVTVGYGDILPVNNQEIILCISNIFIACGVFGYSMNMIGQIIQEFFKYEAENNKHLYIINRYMEKHNISNNLRY